MRRTWLLAVILVAVALFALEYRWDVEASKTFDSSVVKFVRDRFTGEVYAEVYGYSDELGYVATLKKIRNNGHPIKKWDTITGVLANTIRGSIIWLIILGLAALRKATADPPGQQTQGPPSQQ